MEFEIREINDNYDSNLLTYLWKDALPDLDKRRIEWSYRRNPHGKARLYLLYSPSEEKYFGVGAVLPRTFIHKGEEFRCGITADFALLKEYRTLGPALKLQKEMTASNDIDMLLAFPNTKSEGVQLRAGFKVLGNLTRYFKIFKSGPVLRKRNSTKCLAFLSPLIDIYLKLRNLRLMVKDGVDFRLENTFSEDLDQLWHQMKDQAYFLGERDLKYLKWRFEKNPYKSYRVYGVRDGTNRFIGCLIYLLKDNMAYIEDLLIGNEPKDLERLLKYFSIECLKLRLDAVSFTMLRNRRLEDAFKRSGFFSEVIEQKVLVSDQSIEELEADRVFLTLGDCDF